eukprot:365925-Chlamydomonas_euryale.AAC.13
MERMLTHGCGVWGVGWTDGQTGEQADGWTATPVHRPRRLAPHLRARSRASEHHAKAPCSA